MRPRVLLSLLIGAGFAVASAYPAAAAAKATWEGVGLVAGFSELGEAQLLRYDLAARAWLEPVTDPLLAQASPLQIEVDASGIYARQADRVIRIPHDGSGATTVWEGQAAHIDLSGPWLFVLEANVVRSVDKIGGSVAAERELPVGTHDFVVVAPEKRLVFPGTRDLLGVDFGDDGSLGPVLQPEGLGPRHFFHDLAMFPDGRRVLEGRQGHVYDARTLSYVGGVPIEGDEAAFGGGAVFVLGRPDGPDAIVAFSESSLVEIGRIAGAFFGATLLSHGSDLFVFLSGSQGTEVEVHALSEFVLPKAGAPLDPTTVGFRVQQAAVTRDEVAIVLPESHSISPSYLDEGPQLFRWSVAERSYLPSLPLREAASHLVYDPGSDVLYVIYRSRRITFIENPGGDDPLEADLGVAPFEAGSAAWIRGRLVIGSYGFWDGLFTMSGRGVPLCVFGDPFESTPVALAGSETTGRVYLLSDRYPGTIVSFGLGDAGCGQGWSSGPDSVRSNSIVLTASPDGARVFEGTSVRDGATLETIAPLIESGFSSAAWDGDRLVVADKAGGDLRLRAWTSPATAFGRELVIPGLSPGWLGPSGNGLLLVYYRSSGNYPYLETHLAKIFMGEDLDGDGVPNGADLYVLDPSESSDRDGDGVGDNSDAFPDDRDQYADRDGDRIADPLDVFPDDAELATAHIGLQVRVGVPPYGHLEGSLYASVHFFEDGGFLICPSPDACIPGSFQRKRKGRLMLQLEQEIVDALEATLEGDLEEALSDFHGHPVDLALSFRDAGIQLKAAVSRKGKRLSVSLAFPYEARTDDLGRGRLRGTFRIRGSADTMAR